MTEVWAEGGHQPAEFQPGAGPGTEVECFKLPKAASRWRTVEFTPAWRIESVNTA
ncbi:hypothetical protein [Streptomyces hundungensis]|uniref:hypothetical protein n=1 Tax=Streptomyces hundungensis TaxID=1077946 RepID=UPI0031E8F7FE